MCNGCHDISTKAISMYNLCIGYNNGNAYRINFAFMSKNDVLNLIKNAVIIDKKDSVDLNKIVVSNKWKINDTTYKYLCGY